MAGRKVDSKN